jgi:predicted MFS family arabinose efflux permease
MSTKALSGGTHQTTLTRSLAVFLFSLYVATIYDMLYLSFTTILTIFSSVYGFSIELTSLVYLPFGIGMIIALSILMKISDKIAMRLRRKNNGIFEPEMRMPNVIINYPY